MEELNINITNEAVRSDCKTWAYSEKNNKHVTHHEIAITKNRFSHTSEIKEVKQAMKTRTDINIKNVHSVNTFYGLSRNVIAPILLAILAVACIALAFIIKGTAALAIFLVLAVLFAGFAIFIFTRIKPSFYLEINTIIPNGTCSSDSLAYGNANVNVGKKRHSILFYLLLIVFFPIGIIYLLKGKKSNKYKFMMDPEVGYEIVDTIGPMLIDR